MSLKIAVYTIAKNEEALAQRWAQNVKGADEVVVLDTGSTDKTVELLRREGVRVESKIITPWRFDVARNECLKLVSPDIDICISLDMDELLPEGWREAIEQAWTPGTTLLRYPFISEFDEAGNPKRMSWGHKIHARNAYTWKYAVHEVLRPVGHHQEAFTENLRLEHRPLVVKQNDHYQDLILHWTKQEPEEPRYQHYLARNYFDRGQYQDCLNTLDTYFNFPDNKVSSDEKAFTYRMRAWCYEYLNYSIDAQVEALWKAVAYNPRSRENWLHLAELMFKIGNMPNAFAAAVNAFSIKEPSASYMIEPDAWTNKAEWLMRESFQRLTHGESR